MHTKLRNIATIVFISLLVSGCSGIIQIGIYSSEDHGWSYEEPDTYFGIPGKYSYACSKGKASVLSTMYGTRIIAIGPPLIPIIPVFIWSDAVETDEEDENGQLITDNRLTVTVILKSIDTTHKLSSPDISIVIPESGRRIHYISRTDGIIENEGVIEERTINLIYPIDMKEIDSYVVEFGDILHSCSIPPLMLSKDTRTRYIPL